MASFLDTLGSFLQSKLVKPVQGLEQGAGSFLDQLGHSISNIPNFRLSPQTPSLGEVAQSALANPDRYNLFSQAAQGHLATGITPIDIAGKLGGQFVQNKLVTPALNIGKDIGQAAAPNSSLLDRIGSLAGAGANALALTPGGIAYNTVLGGGFGAGKGAIEAGRKGGNLLDSLAAGFTGQHDPGLGTALTDNPFLAKAGNLAEIPLTIAASNPKGAFKSLKDVKNLALNFKDLNPNLNPVLEDAEFKTIAQLGDKFDKAGNVSPEETHTILQLAKEKLSIPQAQLRKMSTGDILAELRGVGTPNQDFSYRQVPGLGFVGKTEAGNLPNTAKSAVSSELQPAIDEQALSSAFDKLHSYHSAPGGGVAAATPMSAFRPEELKALKGYLLSLNDKENQSLRGAVVKSYGNNQDLVFGVIPPKEGDWRGREYLVMDVPKGSNPNALSGRFRLHATPISAKNIVGRVNTNDLFGGSNSIATDLPLTQSTERVRNTQITLPERRGAKALALPTFPMENKGWGKVAATDVTPAEAPAAGAAIPPASGEVPATNPIAPKSAGFGQFWDRARNVIAKQGPSGQKLASGLPEARNLAETTAGKWVSEMPTVRSLSKPDFSQFVDVVEGKTQPANEQVAKAAAEWGKVRAEVLATGQAAGLDIGRLENYFPHVYDEAAFKGDNFQAAIQHLVDSGQAKDQGEAVKLLEYAQNRLKGTPHGNLEFERLVDLPGYQKTHEALFSRYLDSASNRIAQAQVFGKDYEKANQLIAQVGQEGGDTGAVDNLFKISTGQAKYGQLQQKVSKTLRGYNSVTKLGLGALTNAGQSINTATVTGALRTLTSIPKATTPEARDFALKAGVTLDGVLGDLKEGSGFSGKVLGTIGAPGFSTVEKFNRTLAAWAGKGYAEDLAKQAAGGSTSAKNALAKMGLDAEAIAKAGGKLSEEQQIAAARNIVERTQFKVDPQDLPGWTSSPWGKVLTQFKSFAYNQSAFIGREIIQPATQGNIKPLIRFMALALPVGGAISETKNLLRNRPSEENPGKRGLQYVQQAGGLGLASDVVTGLIPQNSKYLPADRATSLAIGTLGGPTVSTAAEGYGSLSQAVQGKPTSLGRFALKQIPLVGSTVQNTVLPYKPGGRAGTGTGKGKKSVGGGTGSLASAIFKLPGRGISTGTPTGTGGKRLTAAGQRSLITRLSRTAQPGSGNGLKLSAAKIATPKLTNPIKVKAPRNPIQRVRKPSLKIKKGVKRS